MNQIDPSQSNLLGSVADLKEDELAPVHTLLGQLQRGRGAGFLWALREPPELVHPLLVHTMTWDPRWDSQVEERADYYANLCLATRLDLAALDDSLRTTPDDRMGGYAFLLLEVLGNLAKRGGREAIDILGDYVSYGPKWDAALRVLAEVQDRKVSDGLADVVCERFSTGKEMSEASVYPLFGEPSLDRLWEQWEQANPCIAKLLSELTTTGIYERVTSRIESPNYKALSTKELLVAIDGANYRQIEKVLLSRLKHSDIQTYREAFLLDNPHTWWVAFNCLKGMKAAEPSYNQVLERVTAYVEENAGDRRKLNGVILRPFGMIAPQLPPESTLPLARCWYSSEHWQLRHMAEEILEAHATTEDIEPVRATLSEALATATPENTDIYRICSALDILVRFPDIGLLPEVEEAFIQVGYAPGRRRAAAAMRMNASAYFQEKYAYECLWDCDAETRQIGCESVSLDMPGAVERLQALATDEFEYDFVKQAARTALQSL